MKRVWDAEGDAEQNDRQRNACRRVAHVQNDRYARGELRAHATTAWSQDDVDRVINVQITNEHFKKKTVWICVCVPSVVHAMLKMPDIVNFDSSLNYT